MTDFLRRAQAPGVHPDAPSVVANALPCSGIMVATPMSGGGLCDQAYVLGLLDLQAECMRRGVPLGYTFLRHESLLQFARNTCVAKFLASPASHLIFVDADIGFTPDAVFRLIAHRQDVVGGSYRKKTHERTEYAVQPKPQGEMTEAGLIEVDGLPTGFLMISRDAAQRLVGAHWESRYSTRDDGEVCDLFGLEYDPTTRTRLSEDLSFCRKWRALGGRVWLDPHILLQHWGMAEFSGHPVEMFSKVEPANVA